MPERTVKRWLQETSDDALSSDDGPIFSTVAKLVEALKRFIPEGTQDGAANGADQDAAVAKNTTVRPRSNAFAQGAGPSMEIQL